MQTLESLIDKLKGLNVLNNNLVLKAFIAIDRKYFVPKELKNYAYEDRPLPIGEGQTISQPFTVAFMLDLLSTQKGDRVLDVGSGSGYTTAMLAHIVGSKGEVVGVEILPSLLTFGKNNLSPFNFKNSEIHLASSVIGFREKAPYDKILVSAEAREIPKELINQLKIGGIMVIPIQNDICKIEKITEEKLKIEKYPGFSFVPLIN